MNFYNSLCFSVFQNIYFCLLKLSISTLCDISNVLVDSRIQLESINKYLKEDKEFDYESIDYIFSAQMECWHT